jgi:hypothetical protein
MGTMKNIRLLILLLCAAALPLLLSAQTATPARKAVVVELFTSEGCNTCPPADTLLARLREERTVGGAEVVLLGMHVDYWDHLGWRDRFSSATYTERQLQYKDKLHLQDAYTPQIVVDGTSQFLGSDSPHVHQGIAQAAQQPAVAEIQIAPAGESKFQVTVKGGSDASGDVMLAVTEDNLVSKVSAGENKSRELHHSAVVREFKSLGHLRNGNFDDRVSVNIKKDWKRDELRIVVFVQRSQGGAIEGAASLPLAEKSASRL